MKVVCNGFVWGDLILSRSKKKQKDFYIPFFEPILQFKKDLIEIFRSTNLKLIPNIKILIPKQLDNAYTQHQTFCFSFFTIKTKKEQAINFIPEIFYSYDTFYYNKQKGTNNKFHLL